jgi:hypothetical protein
MPSNQTAARCRKMRRNAFASRRISHPQRSSDTANAMPKVSDSSWNGGTCPVAVVNSASVAHSRMAMKPISVARRRSG